MTKKTAYSILAASVFGICPTSYAELTTGFARTDITPPLGVHMRGYDIERRAKSVLDPLEVNCVSFCDGVHTALVFQVDDCHLGNEIGLKAKAAITQATGIPSDYLYLHSSHTHDGGNLTEPGLGGVDDLYQQFALTRIADTALMAVRDLKPSKLSCGRGVARRISFGRRYKMKNGEVWTNPGVGNPDIVGPAGTPPDEQVQVLRIDREGTKALCLINFQTHPDVIGGETISGDWPGLTRKVFEAANGDAVRCLVLNGAQGDVNHVNVRPRGGEFNGLKRDFDDVTRGYEHAKHMANVVAAAALGTWLKCVPLKAGPISAGTKLVRVPAQREYDKKVIARAHGIWAEHKAGRDAQLPWKGMRLTTEIARAERIVELEKGPAFFDLYLSAIAIGPELAFAGFPGEPFNEIGRTVKEKAPFQLTLVTCLTNGSMGYFPTSDCYKGSGSYESVGSLFGPSVGYDMTYGMLGLLRELKH